jgi:hypothetical protein
MDRSEQLRAAIHDILVTKVLGKTHAEVDPDWFNDEIGQIVGLIERDRAAGAPIACDAEGQDLPDDPHAIIASVIRDDDEVDAPRGLELTVEEVATAIVERLADGGYTITKGS